ncbi:MAG: hypothetical protein QW303_01090 [Nitrososphaerota archaeon]
MILNNKMIKLWLDHVYWTREFIITKHKKITDIIVNMLIKNQNDIGSIFETYFPNTKKSITALLIEHIQITAQYIEYLRENDIKAKELLNKWYQNADKISAVLSKLLNIQENEIKSMMYEHINLTNDEIILHLQNKYEEASLKFLEISEQALKMGQILTYAIARKKFINFLF